MSTILMVGDTVDCVVGSQFLPNQTGLPIPVRTGGRLTQWDRYGNAIVEWPTGESYSYEAALLRKCTDVGAGE